MSKNFINNLTGVAMALLIAVGVMLPQQAMAAVDTNCTKSFLGIPTWYAYLEVVPANTVSGASTNAPGCVILNSSGTPIEGIDDVGAVMPNIIAALLDALLRIAGTVAFFYVVFSGFKFVFAQGNPDKEKQARSSLFNAVIGLMISMVAAFVVGFIGKRLGG